jgi:HSP20 family protein
MENGVLTVQGSREETINEERSGYHRLERAKGTFSRRFTLPDTADAEQINANLENGVLEIVINKKKAVQPRKITIKAK